MLSNISEESDDLISIEASYKTPPKSRKIVIFLEKCKQISLPALQQTIAFSINSTRLPSDILILTHMVKLKRHFGLSRNSSFESLPIEENNFSLKDADLIDNGRQRSVDSENAFSQKKEKSVEKDENLFVYQHNGKHRRLELRDPKHFTKIESEYFAEHSKIFGRYSRLCKDESLRYYCVLVFTQKQKDCAILLTKRFSPSLVGIGHKNKKVLKGYKGGKLALFLRRKLEIPILVVTAH